MLLHHQIVAATVQCVRSVQHMLDEITPCACVFPGTARAAERSDEPVVCLQEKRAHHPHLHRTSRKVRGGTGVWANTVGMIPYNQTWKGRYKVRHSTGGDSCTHQFAAGDLGLVWY